MKIAAVPAYERERLKALNDYFISGTLAESDFDDIAALASSICDAPVALISFIDANRQWFKSHHGLPVTEIPRDNSFCTYAINAPEEILIANHLSKDERFKDHPFVVGEPHASFYAGVPLVNHEGCVLGILSVLDTRPRTIEPQQAAMLQSLARQVVAQLELRKKDRLLQQKDAELNMALADMDQISFLASHDLRTPLNNIISLVDIMQTEFAEKLGDDGNEYFQYLSGAAHHLSGMLGGVLSYSRAARLPVSNKENIAVVPLMNDVIDSLQVPENVSINLHNNAKSVYSSPEALKQVLMHLLKNAMQYGDKPKTIIDIMYYADKDWYTFEIRDDGEGVANEDMDKMFILFKRLKDRDKTVNNMGVGLSIVKRLIGNLGGTIGIASTEGSGTTITFSLPKE